MIKFRATFFFTGARMPSPIGPHLGLPPPFSSSASPAVFKNHQNWQISLSRDPHTGAPTFQVIDRHGLPHTLTEFIVEEVDPRDVQRQGLANYLQQRLSEATPFQVHIENADQAIPFVRFGAHGLRGGFPRYLVYAASGLQVGAGIALCATGAGAPFGGVLISSGLGGGLNAFNEEGDDVDGAEYLRQTGYGAVSGVVSGGVGSLANGAGAFAKFGYQVASGVAGNASAKATRELVEKGKLPSAGEFAKDAIVSGVSGGLGAGAGKLAGQVGGKFVNKGAGTAAKVAKAAFKGAASSGTSTVSANAMTMVGEEEPKDGEKKQKTIGDNLLQSILVGAAISGGIKGAKKAKLAQDQKGEKLKDAAAKVEDQIKDLEADATATKSEIEQAQQEVQKAQDATAAAQKETAQAKAQYDQAKQRHDALAKEYQTRFDRVKEHVLSQQKNGIRAKIGDGNVYYKSPDDIARRLIAGERVTWVKGSSATGKGRLGGESRVREPLIDQFEQSKARLAQADASLNGRQSSSQQAQSKAQQAEGDLAGNKKKADDIGKRTKERQGNLERKKAYIKKRKALPLPSAKEAEPTDARKRVRDLVQPDATVKSSSGLDFKRTGCTKAELVQHVVLVHAIVPNGIFSNLSDEQLARFDDRRFQDTDYLTSFCFKEALTADGSVGSHYDFEEREYQGKLMDRPHQHWCWNQLAPANSGGDWEDAQIAVLEPLAAFEETSNEKPFCMSPYDTFTFGAHKLSKNAVILVPESLVDEARVHLAGFEGRVVGVPPGQTIRSNIIDALGKHYPNTWHMCDEEGNRVGDKDQSRDPAYDQIRGYRAKTCVKTGDGRVIPLLKGEGLKAGDQISLAFQEFGEAKRFIGLHEHSPTKALETDYTLKILEKFTEGPSMVANHPQFAGKIDGAPSLGRMVSLKTYQLYQKLLEYDPETRAVVAADYYMNTAIFADLASIYCADNEASDFPISTIELKMIIGSARPYLINLLENIHQLAHSGNPGQAYELFKAYRKLLTECLADHQKAVAQLADLSASPSAAGSAAAVQLPLKVAQTEWEQVEIPADGAFDLRTSWPLKRPLYTFVIKVLRALPKERESQIQLYQELRAQTPSGLNEHYRINVIINLLEWVYLEQTYSTLRGDEGPGVLAGKLSTMDEALAAQYGLVTDDYTQTVGDCLFDNVLRQIDSPLPAQTLRDQTVLFMRQHPADYQSYFDFSEASTLKKSTGANEGDIQYQTWDEYLGSMAQPLVWATEVEIQALAHMLDRPIILFAPREDPKFYNRASTNDPILLYHKNQNHFVSCLPLKGLTPRDLLPVIENP